jgi:hypothetical protein
MIRPMWHADRMRVRIVGTDLPGTGGRLPGVRIGVQHRDTVVDALPADAASVTFELEVTVVATADGLDFRGPLVHGRRGERFLYLVWVQPDAGGAPKMFRRAKLQLAPVAQILASTVSDADGRMVIGSLALTDAKGGPVCASVRPPAISWQLD